MEKLPPRTTRYNGTSDSEADYTDHRLMLSRWMNSYGFSISGPHGHRTYMEIGPQAALRLVTNLTAALKLNGHWKEPKT